MKADEIIQLTNQVREAEDREPLTENDKLDRSAYLKAKDMCTMGYFSHDDWTVFVDVSGYNYERAGENLAKNYSTSALAVSAWVASPDHMKNILGDYKETGVATIECDGKSYAVQHFGTPYTPSGGFDILPGIILAAALLIGSIGLWIGGIRKEFGDE